MLRSSARLFTRSGPVSAARLTVPCRSISSSPMNAEGATKQGKGEKQTVEDVNPVTARAETAKNAAKSVLDGAKGIAEKVTGNGEGSKSAMEASGKNQIEEQVEHGRKAGLEKKGEEQGGL